MRITGGFQDTRNNNEDFALTPYLFSVILNGEIIKIFGIGICLGYYSLYIGIGFGIPKDVPLFIVHKQKKL